MWAAEQPTPRSLASRALLTLGLLAVAGLAAPAAAYEPPQRFKILTEQAGVYRLTYEALEAAGLRPGTDEPFALLNRDRAVPIWRRDADGRFGPGDEILFRAEHLLGEHSYHHDHSRYNVYFLVAGADGPALRTIDPPPLTGAPPRATLGGVEHFEEDVLLMRFGGTAEGRRAADAWFWERLTQIDPKPFRLPLELGDYDPEGDLRLRIALRGWSRPFGRRQAEVPDHVVEVTLNGQPIGATEWHSQEEHLLEISSIDPEIVRRGRSFLEIRVPERTPPGEEEPMIDVVLLNWVELEYARRGGLGDRGQETLDIVEHDRRVVVTHTAASSRVLAFGDGTLHRPASTADGTEHGFLVPTPAPERLVVVLNDDYLEPVAVLPDVLTDLRATTRRADYLMIAHPSLLEAVEPLAAFHRRRGLAVEVVNVFDIYDEFNHGIVHPRAIRDFVAFTREHWRPPGPRFVLLVGDASWDVKNEQPDPRNYADWTYVPGEVRKGRSNRMTPYDEEAPLDRNLIPTWKYYGAQGHAASDNYFVAVEGDDHLPDLAIGRFAVVTPDEVSAVVHKTIRYMSSALAGPWSRSILWITNESPSFQQRSDALAEEMGARGFTAQKIYPSTEDADNSEHQAALLAALDHGQLLVHFLGHGGRYIWRTGPPDYRKNHDLFTLDHLDRLTPSDRLPVVLSMTCYSAPFDHPAADSIGEKFVRLADRGAVAVFAASWRNSPSADLSRFLLEEIVDRPTLGEAIVAAKRRTERRDLVETYNLLGDPALELQLPSHAGGKRELGSSPLDTERPPGAES